MCNHENLKIHRSHGVTVSTQDSESCDRGSNPREILTCISFIKDKSAIWKYHKSIIEVAPQYRNTDMVWTIRCRNIDQNNETHERKDAPPAGYACTRNLRIMAV